jgi:hypothetical protein
MLDSTYIEETLKPVFWDYEVDVNQLYLITLGEEPAFAFFTKEYILKRILERVPWYIILKLYGKDYLRLNLTHELIEKIRNQEIRNRYELVRKVLHGEPVSLTGWSLENRTRLKNTTLSDRWYRP